MYLTELLSHFKLPLLIWLPPHQVWRLFAKCLRRLAFAPSSSLCSASDSSTTIPAPSACRICTSYVDWAHSPTRSTSAFRSVWAASGFLSETSLQPGAPHLSPHALQSYCCMAWSRGSTALTSAWRSCLLFTLECFTSCTTGNFLQY